MQRTIDGEASRMPMFSPLNPAAPKPVPGVSLAPPESGRRTSTRAAAIALAAVVVVQALLALTWISATHTPRLHRVPLAITAADAGTATQLATVLNGIGNHPVAATAMTTQTADAALHAHGVDAVLVVGPNASDTLYVAQAAGATEAQLLATSLTALDASQNRKLQTIDAIPLPVGDSTGLVPLCLVLSWIAAGVVGALTLASLAGRTAGTVRAVRSRVLGFAGYALACGLVTTVLAHLFYGVTTGAFVWTVVAGLVVTFAAACTTSALRAIAGPRTTLAVLTVVVAVAVPASGGLVPHHLLPTALRAIGPYLPVGAGVDLVRNVLSFGHHGIGGALVVLVLWAATGVGLCIVSTTRAQRQQGATNNR